MEIIKPQYEKKDWVNLSEAEKVAEYERLRDECLRMYDEKKLGSFQRRALTYEKKRLGLFWSNEGLISHRKYRHYSELDFQSYLKDLYPILDSILENAVEWAKLAGEMGYSFDSRYIDLVKVKDLLALYNTKFDTSTNSSNPEFIAVN